MKNEKYHLKKKIQKIDNKIDIIALDIYFLFFKL